ncbi:hypothetical protein [Breoghania sp. JC706]|uniref:hypothetical protein n=1 Tax=Breoghania sp. JC706 TaxID=3117732 RepID=UPI0030087935
MSGPWKDHLAALRRVVDAELGETVRVEPMRRGQYNTVPDPDRPAFDIDEAHLRVSGGQDDLGGVGSRSWSTLVAGGEAELHVDPDAYPAALTLRKGDQVVATDRLGAPRFEVARVDPDQRNRLVLQMSLKL